MGLALLPDELLLSIAESWPCRTVQIRQLSALLPASLPGPSTIVVHGPEATAKTSIVKAYLNAATIKHAFVPCNECITGRHLLERTLAACVDALQLDYHNDTAMPRVESLSTLTSLLERLLQGIESFTIVFDGVDQQREAQPTLLPALTRLGDIIPNLTILLIVAHPHPRLLHVPGAPHIAFPPYSREQAIQILALDPPRIFLDSPVTTLVYSDTAAAEDDAWLWSRFCAAVWDSLASGAARDLIGYKSIAHKLWRPFVLPIVEGTYGTRDFSKLMVAQRTLFQSEDCLLDHVVSDTTEASTSTAEVTHDLPYYSKWLLCAAYLASYNPPRQDVVYFMKASERKRRKKGGGTAAGRQSKTRKIPRHLLSPSPFPLDRLFAILHAIVPHDFVPTIDVYTQLATLCSLRLLLRTAVIGGDVLEPGSKWKVSFGLDYATKLARSVGLDITDYIAE